MLTGKFQFMQADPFASTVELGDIDVLRDLDMDAPPGTDADKTSPSLREYHRVLWSKPLPKGQPFTLTSVPGGYLQYKSSANQLVLSSDTIATAHRALLGGLYQAAPPRLVQRFRNIGGTIAGHIIFPGKPIDGQQTINQSRGIHPKIRDRFDLTLECIRRHYSGMDSPLSKTLARYADFFELFESFQGYVDFFLLNDLVDQDGVRFLLPFDDFASPPLPADLPTYVRYLKHETDFIEARAVRIARYVDQASRSPAVDRSLREGRTQSRMRRSHRPGSVRRFDGPQH